MNDAEIRIGPDDWDEAIEAVAGPQLVVAGPGTGKTEFLVRRMVHLIESGVAKPGEIQFVTFSRRAAAETRGRILAGLTRTVPAIGSATFHSFALRLREAYLPNAHLELLTGPEQVSLVGDLLERENPSRWPAHLAGLLRSPTLAADVADFLMRAAERSLSPDDVRAREIPDWKALPDLMERYAAELKSRNRLDYAQLIFSATELVEDPDIGSRVADQFRFLLVDEYQDTSPAQARLLEAIARHHHNITAAGDPYQSVYSFRGAEIENIARFPDRFRDSEGGTAKRIVLTTSFRVPATILDAALRVTAGGQLPGEAGPVVPASHPGSVETYVFDQGSAEADWIAGEVERLHLADGVPYHRIAILLRSKRTLLPELSRALSRQRIPHDAPDARLVDHPAVQMVFDLARLATGDRPGYDRSLDSVARRLLLGPLVSARLGRERELVRLRLKTGSSWASVLETAPEAENLWSLIAQPGWAHDLPAADGFWEVWTRALVPLATEPSMASHRAAWTSFAQVLERQRDRDRSVSLVDYWRASMRDDFEATPLISFHPGGDKVVLTTLHQAKGLEFDTVFIADADDSLFPDLRRGTSLLGTQRLAGFGASSEWKRFRVQEEMRLAYTAMCRARRRVVWTSTAAGIDEGERRPSRFLLSVAESADRAMLGPPIDADGPPTTRRELEVRLRRTLCDPTAPAAERLAAAELLNREWDPERFAGVAVRGSDRGLVDERSSLSPSQADAYATCPRRYVLERRLGVGDPDSPYAHFGTLVHEVLERVEAAILDGRIPEVSEEALLTTAEEVWSESASFGSPVLNAAQLAKARTLLERLAQEWPADARDVVAVEYPLSIELDGTTWRGRADRIDRPAPGVLRIVDHKTGKGIPSKAEAAGALQLGFYLLAAGADRDLAAQGRPQEAEFWYPAAKTKDFRRKFDPERLPEIENLLIELGRAIRSENWEPRAGAHCGNCGVKLVCPMWPDGSEAYLP